MPCNLRGLNCSANLALVSAIYLALCASSVFATNDYQTPEGWRTECLGRSQFDMPPHTVWHLRMPFDNSVSYVTDDPWFGRYMDYGTEPVSGVYKLVRIRISPETTRAAFDNAVGVEMPNKTKAQMRVLRNRVNERRERFDPEKDDREQYIEDLMNLDAENERYSDMISDITRFKIFIDFDKSKGRPTEELEAQLADYERQIAALPTDERYEHERAFDLGIPDAAGAWHPDKMVALLWRNNRIYHFEFGPKNGEYESNFDALEPLARDLLARFRPRAEFEIPQEPGVCLPFGFIADSGSEKYDAYFSWHSEGTPYVLNNLKLSNSVGDALELLPMLTKRLMGNPFPNALNITDLGPRRIDIGSTRGTFAGRAFQAINPESDQLTSHTQYVLNAGAVAGKYTPTLLFKQQTFANDQPPPPIEQAEEDVLNMMRSFRPLPGMQALYDEAESRR